MSHSILTALSFLFVSAVFASAKDRKVAVQRAVDLVSQSATTYTDKRDCISCHHQSLPVMAMAEAKAAGYTVSEESISGQTLYVQDYFKGRLKRMHNGNGVIGGPYTAGYALSQMADAKVAKETTIDALVAYLSNTQKSDGSWRIRTHRPPLEDSHFTATALAIRGLKKYGSNNEAVASGVRWLNNAEPESTEDHVFRVLGLHWAGEDASKAVTKLLSLQREDHGWGQLPEMGSDAYATGQVLYALLKSGFIPENSPKLTAGKQWLLTNQKADGSWHVKSRSRPIQKYFESGFPHGKDQFISISATCWAIMALVIGEVG